MADLAIFTGRSITKDQYETLRKEIKWEKSHPEGVILHVAGFDEAGGIHVADVWESPEALNKFVTSSLMPTMKKHKIQPPDVQMFPVHNLNAYPSIEPHKLKKAK